MDSPTLLLSTAIGSVMGTVNYMSPEQAQGEPLDGRTDVFSLGQMLLEMVTGKRLFVGKTQNDVLQLLRSEQEPLAAGFKLAGVPKALEEIIRKSLRRDVAARYATAQQMLDDLKILQRRRTTKWLRRVVVGCVIGILALLSALGLMVKLSTTEIWEEKVLRDGHTKWVHSVAFSPDGRLLVSVSDDKTVIVWDFAQRKRLKTLPDHAARVNAVAFSLDGKLFATGSHDKTIIVWDATTFEKITTLSDPRDAVRSVAFSPDGKWLAAVTSAAQEDGSGRYTSLWNTSRWVKEREISYGADYGPILFSPDSRLLVTNQVRWDLVSDKQIANADMPDDKKWGGWNWAAISPNAKTLVSTNSIGEVLFRELNHSDDLTDSRLMQESRAHQDHGRAVAFSPDGKLVATGTDDILLWDTETRRIVSRFDDISSVWSLAFSPDGRSLVSAHGDGSIQVRELNDRRRTVGFDGHGNHVLVVATSPDGKTIASAGKDGAVILWNAETEQKEAVLFGHETRVVNLAFSPDGTWLASFDQDGYLIRWDLEKHLQQWKVPACRGTECLDISRDGKWIANTCRIYESSKGQEIGRWDKKQTGFGMADSAAFSPDGKSFAIAGGRKIVLLDTQNKQTIAKQEANSNLTRISFSPNGQHILTGSEDGTLTWWDAATLQKNAEVKEHKAAISAAVFSPDGKTMASADKDQIIVWDANSRKRMAIIENQAIPVYSLAFLRDGKRLIAAKRDRTVRVYTHHQMRWGKPLD